MSRGGGAAQSWHSRGRSQAVKKQTLLVQACPLVGSVCSSLAPSPKFTFLQQFCAAPALKCFSKFSFRGAFAGAPGGACRRVLGTCTPALPPTYFPTATPREGSVSLTSVLETRAFKSSQVGVCTSMLPNSLQDQLDRGVHPFIISCVLTPSEFAFHSSGCGKTEISTWLAKRNVLPSLPTCSPGRPPKPGTVHLVSE